MNRSSHARLGCSAPALDKGTLRNFTRLREKGHLARILVIDDSEGVLSMLGIILRSAGHEVQTAMNGKEGLEAHLAHPADIIITDIFMPGMSGLEVIKILRAGDAHVKIIAMSALPDQGNPLGMARRLGANEALTKPFLGHDILTVVQDVLKLQA